MAWFRKENFSPDSDVRCAGCGRVLRRDLSMNEPAPGYPSEKIHKFVGRNPPYYSLICPSCRSWTIRAPI